jgi:hypothetical protein
MKPKSIYSMIQIDDPEKVALDPRWPGCSPRSIILLVLPQEICISNYGKSFFRQSEIKIALCLSD